jgi:Zn-dependent membrane protease YugP
MMTLLHRLFELPVWPTLVSFATLVALAFGRARASRLLARGATWSAPQGLDGESAARELARSAGLDDLHVARVTRSPRDWYDPAPRTLRLQNRTASDASLAAWARVAHELGHALQQQERAHPLALALRDRLAVVARLAAPTALLLFAVGFALDMPHLGVAGLLTPPAAALALASGLPLERDASRRGRRLIAAAALTRSTQDLALARLVDAAAWNELLAVLPWPRTPPAHPQNTRGIPLFRAPDAS